MGKALGLIAFLIIDPLWQVIENKNIHVLDSSIYYREILEFMESAVEDTDSCMSGKSFLSICNRQDYGLDVQRLSLKTYYVLVHWLRFLASFCHPYNFPTYHQLNSLKTTA
jgi:hypothetical protein